MYSDMVDFVNF